MEIAGKALRSLRKIIGDDFKASAEPMEPAAVKTVFREIKSNCKKDKHFKVFVEGGKQQEDVFTLIHMILIKENRRRKANGDPGFSYEIVLTE